MLVFQGIQIEGERREKYYTELKIKNSYFLAYQLLKSQEINISASLKSLQEELKLDYESPVNNKKKFLIAQKMRAKDILLFFQNYQKQKLFLYQSLEVLIQAVEIEKKWLQIEDLLAQQKLEKKFLEKEKNRDFLEDFLSFIWLYFLDQIEEVPPLNLKLYFVAGKFPQHNWCSTDYSERLKPQKWIPLHPYCNFSFLRSRLWEYFYQKNTSIIQNTIEKEQAQQEAKLKNLHFSYQPQKEKQERLFESGVGEIIRLFIQQFLSQYQSTKGINHFIAILYQLQKKYKNGFSFFDWKEHFELVLKNQEKNNLQKHIETVSIILEELQKLKVIRVFEEKNQVYEVHKPLLMMIEKIYYPHQQYLKKNLQQNKIKLSVDSAIIPSLHNKINFTASLFILPKGLFQEKQRIYPFLLLLCVYLYDSWFYEYKRFQGKISRKIDDIIVGSCIQVPRNGKYRIIQRIRSALHYLKEKKYIGSYQIQNPTKNNLGTVYLLSAPSEFHQKIENYFSYQAKLT